MSEQNKRDSERAREMREDMEDSCELREDCPVCDEELDTDGWCEECGEWRTE